MLVPAAALAAAAVREAEPAYAARSDRKRLLVQWLLLVQVERLLLVKLIIVRLLFVKLPGHSWDCYSCSCETCR
jgi:hypothetical protein